MSTPASFRVVEGHWLWFRHVWRGSILTGFLQPLLFLAGMGLGVGALVSANGSETTMLGRRVRTWPSSPPACWSRRR